MTWRLFDQVALCVIGAVLAAALVMQLWWWFMSAPPEQTAVPTCPQGTGLYEAVFATKVEYPVFHCFDWADARDNPTPGPTPTPTQWPDPLATPDDGEMP